MVVALPSSLVFMFESRTRRVLCEEEELLLVALAILTEELESSYDWLKLRADLLASWWPLATSLGCE